MQRLRRVGAGAGRLAVVGLGCPSLRRFVGGCVLLLAIVGILIHATQYRWFAIPSVKAIDSAMIIASQSGFDETYAHGVRLYVMHAPKWGSSAPWAKPGRRLEMPRTTRRKLTANA